MTIEVGDKVKLLSTGEVGIVVHTWHDEELDTQNNYIAFFGEEFPDGKPIEIPYVLKYISGSLQILED